MAGNVLGTFELYVVELHGDDPHEPGLKLITNAEISSICMQTFFEYTQMTYVPKKLKIHSHPNNTTYSNQRYTTQRNTLKNTKA